MKSKIKEWLSNKNNLMLLAIIFFAFAIRLYYFFLTKDQALGWDESVYMLKAKNMAFGLPENGWAGVIRPILFPFVASFFLKIGLDNTFIHFMFIILSLFGIFLIYHLGKNVFNERVGLISAFLLSIFSMDIFYTTKFLVDVPQVVFILFGAFLFAKREFKNGSESLTYWVLPVLALGILTRVTVGLFVLSILLYLLIIYKHKLFIKQEWYISGAIAMFAFSPYLIYCWKTYGNPIKFLNPLNTLFAQKVASNAVTNERSSVMMEYIHYFPTYMNWIFIIAFVLGTLILFYHSIRNFNSKEDLIGRKTLFLFTWIIIPFCFFAFFVGHFENRYIMIIFPAVFIISGLAFDKLYLFIRKHNKLIAIIVIISLLIIGAYHNLKETDKIINRQLSYYEEYRNVGEWIKENSVPEDIILSSTIPLYTYNSERKTYDYARNESALLINVDKLKPKYLILGTRDRQVLWINNWTKNNPDKVTPVYSYYLDSNKAKVQPDATVYQFASGPKKINSFF